MPNAWEIKHKLNPRSDADAKADLDGDGLSNILEYRLGGLPQMRTPTTTARTTATNAAPARR